MPRPLHLESAGETHTGKVRDDNEDRFAMLDHLGLFLVADGMGGHVAGEVAATLAIDTVRAFFEDPELTSPDDAHNALACFIDAVKCANTRIHEEALQDQTKRGMGTTLAGVLVWGSCLCVAHVGDSRVYRFRDRRLDLLTEDHSVLNECLWKGMAVDQAEALPYGSALTRALGTRDTIQVSARLEQAMPGDLMLICSDGISGVLDRMEIAGLLAEAADLRATALRFIARANDAGGPDNATVVLLRWTL
jgi:serine/threonine protein phosphatase PrpC